MHDHHPTGFYFQRPQTRAEMLLERKQKLAALAKNRWAK